MRYSRRSPRIDYRWHDARRIADEKVLEEDRWPAEVQVLYFDRDGKRITDNSSQHLDQLRKGVFND
jgi:hypothetical protein